MRSKGVGIRGFVIGALTAGALCFPAGAQHASKPTSSRAVHSIAPRLQVEGLPNAAQVATNLYRGGVPTKQGFQRLAEMGINVVVDLRGSNANERKLVTKLGMEYVPLPWHCPFPRDATFARFLKLLQDNAGKKVFVHCRLGDDRVGMVIAAYRMAEQGWTAKEAMKEMEAYGFSFSHRFICPGLASYEAHFPQSYAQDPVFQDLREEPKLSTQHQ